MNVCKETFVHRNGKGRRHNSSYRFFDKVALCVNLQNYIKCLSPCFISNSTGHGDGIHCKDIGHSAVRG